MRKMLGFFGKCVIQLERMHLFQVFYEFLFSEKYEYFVSRPVFLKVLRRAFEEITNDFKRFVVFANIEGNTVLECDCDYKCEAKVKFIEVICALCRIM